MKVKLAEAQLHNGQVPAVFKTLERNPNTFEKALLDRAIEHKKEVCSQILEQIDAQSQALRKSLTPLGIKRYTRLVRAFMKEAMDEAYELTSENRWDRAGYRKNMIIVKKVNQSLEELMDSVLHKEKSQLDLVAKMDEIRGLLLDFYL